MKTTISWNTEDIYELERILNSLSDDELENVKWDALPSVEFPDDIDTNEVWAMDKQGRVLYGPISDAIEIGFDESDSITTLDILREKQNKSLSFELNARKLSPLER